ncbi:phosphotransferase enzyme family protein [Bacteroidota bacterium]
MHEITESILEAFGLVPSACRITPLGKGHIHDTYIVSSNLPLPGEYILQRINTDVFQDLHLLMSNLGLITSHIAEKNRKAGKEPKSNGIVYLSTNDAKNWYGNEAIGYWRMCWLIEEQHSYEEATTHEIAFEGGKAIAEFQSNLADLDPELIGDTIPRFHDLRMRVEQFDKSLTEASAERLKNAEHWIHFTKEHSAQYLELITQTAKWNVALRLTHNDTKFNNILFNKDGQATCLIDLDTVMKGYAWFDFGDALRTCASTAPEDEPDEGKIGFRIDIYEGFARGFVQEATSYLTDDEIGLLHQAPLYFTFMQGVRFLADYLNGDSYYKISYPDHNLIRARSQYLLMQRMLEVQDKMKVIVDRARQEKKVQGLEN